MRHANMAIPLCRTDAQNEQLTRTTRTIALCRRRRRRHRRPGMFIVNLPVKWLFIGAYVSVFARVKLVPSVVVTRRWGEASECGLRGALACADHSYTHVIVMLSLIIIVRAFRRGDRTTNILVYDGGGVAQ